MVVEFIQNYANLVIQKNETINCSMLESELFRNGFSVVYCVPSNEGCKFRIHTDGGNFIDGILNSSGSVLV